MVIFNNHPPELTVSKTVASAQNTIQIFSIIAKVIAVYTDKYNDMFNICRSVLILLREKGAAYDNPKQPLSAEYKQISE